MDRAELLQAGDRNLAATLRHLAVNAPAASVDDDGRILLVSSSPTWPGPYHNGVMRLDPSVPPGEVLDRAHEFFASRCPGYCVWIAAHADADLERAALDRGYADISATGTPRMALEGPIGLGRVPEGVTLHEVADEAARRDFVAVTVEAYADSFFPLEAVEAHLGALAALRGDGVRAVLARLGGGAVAAALSLSAGGVGGIQLVGTVPAARGHGVGELITRWAAQAGFDSGAPAVVLEASEDGEPLYRRLGFEEVSRYRWCLGPPS